MYHVIEGNGVVQLVLIFSNPSSFDIIVQVMATDISAAGVNSTECVPLNPDNDYTMGLHNVTFPVNLTTRSVDIPVCDDRIFEGDESFSVLIVSNSLPDNVINGTVDQATVIIVDDDCKLYIHKCILLIFCCFIAITISFNQMMYRANESDGTVEIMINLSNPSMTDITVQIVSSDITAISESTNHDIIKPSSMASHTFTYIYIPTYTLYHTLHIRVYTYVHTYIPNYL